ncbi:MAG: hypothetical protein J6J11_09445 [Treponema sp.]|nr:hypothetical protein [Treponema sp.]
MNQVRNFFDYVSHHLVIGLTTEEKSISAEMEEKVDETQKELRILARHRIEEGKNVKTELQYMDIVRKIEKAGDYIYGIAKSL